MNIPIRNKGRAIAWIYTICISVFALLPQTAMAVVETVTYTMNPDEVKCLPATASDGESYSCIEWKGKVSSQGEEGAPDLPCDHVYFLVPQNTRNFRISTEVSSQKCLSRKLTDRPMPVQASVSLNTNPEEIRFVKPDTGLYESASGAYAEVIGDGIIFGDRHIVQVAVCPISYSDTDMTVSIYPEMTLSLEYDYCDVSELKDTPLTPENNPMDSSEVLSLLNIINRESSSQLNTLALNPNDGGNPFSIRNYYIITPESLREGVENLAVWKRQKGYRVTVTTIESILSQPKYKTGQYSAVSNEPILDPACSLRAYLQDEFLRNGTFYCLLIGDYRTSMPIRKSVGALYSEYDKSEEDPYYNSKANGSHFIPTDKYFSNLTTKWTLDPSLCSDYVIPSTSGYYPDIIVGRLLCSTPKELDNYFQKLRIYESYPGKGDDAYLMNALYFEQYSVSQGSLLGCTTRANEELDIFENVTFIQDKCHFKYYNNKPDIQTIPHCGNDIIGYMHRCGYSSWAGHGSPTSVQTCNYLLPDTTRYCYAIIPINSYKYEQRQIYLNDEKPNGLDVIDNVNYPGVTFSIACTITPFDRYEGPDKYNNYIKKEDGHIFDIPYNMGSAYTVSGLNGGVALIGNTREGYSLSSSKQQINFSSQIKKTPKIGIAEAISKNQSNSSTFAKDAQNLIGDPEFEMWLNRPQKFNIEYDGNSRPDFSGENLSGAYCSIYYGQGVPSIGNISSNPSLFQSSIWNNMPLISIWRTGYLPDITLYALQGTYTNVKKRYMPHKAFFGHKESTATTSECVIGKNAEIDVDVMTSVDINSGFHAMDGGKVNIRCHEDITASGELVKAGGDVTLSGENILLAPGFKVEAGGVFTATTTK